MASEGTAFPSPTKIFHRDVYPAIDPSLPGLSTANKNVVVTGAGGGIGSQIANAFAKSGAANIALIGRTEASLASTKASVAENFSGTKFHILTADLTDASSIQKALARFAAAVDSGKIDILVANAGYLHTPKPLAQVDADDWWSGFNINVRGNFNLLLAFLPFAVPDATIINIGTAATHLPFVPGHSGYAASKLAAAQMFDYFRMENPGLRVVQFHPGVIATDMSKKTAESGMELPLDDREFPSADFALLPPAVHTADGLE